MIISTNKSDTLLKRAFDKRRTVVIAPERMFDQLSLDPTIENRECYVITNEDISASRLKTKFEQAVAAKHPAVKIIFINKSSKPIYPNGLPGIDAILQKPKPDDIQKTVSAVTSSETITAAIGAGMTEGEMKEIPEFNPQEVQTTMGFNESMIEDNSEFEVDTQPEQLPPTPQPTYVEQPVVEPVQERESDLVGRIKSAGSVSDMSVLMREITASTLIKDLIDSNSTYAGIEEKLKSINDTIFAIMNDNTIKSLDEKLSKVHALLHDKAFFSAKGDTIIEQRLEEVIDLVCTRTSELLQSRLSEIEEAIRRVDTHGTQGTSSARLAGLNEARANIIVELRTFEAEIGDLAKYTDMLAIDTATDIAKRSSDVTGNQWIDDNIRARGVNVVSDETNTAARAAIEITVDKIPDVFKELKLKVITLQRMMSKVFELDSEIIAAQQAQINFLKSRNIEDTVVAKSLLKKSLRVFIGEEGVGRSIIPYLMSRYISRQNANVLCIDITGQGKYSQYGIQAMSLDTYMSGMAQQEFLLVSGSIENSIAAAQKIVTMLLKAADYYRVINIIMSPEQKEMFATIATDVLSVNFMVDTNVLRIERMREIIEQCRFENVAQRVILNRCDIPIRTIISKLGLDDRIDFQTCVIPNVHTITDACVNGFNPYGISGVDLIMEEVVRYAKS